MVLPDISGSFKFQSWNSGAHSYKEAQGELGVPGQVATHRSRYAQVNVSRGTGEHAGHLIGTQFGAPGDLRNLGLQNPNMNSFAPKIVQPALGGAGGSYHHLESQWGALLKQGYKVFVTVVDKYRANEQRPFTRTVKWTETSPNGVKGPLKILEFGNFSSPQGRMYTPS